MATDLPSISSEHAVPASYTCMLHTPEETCTLAGLLASSVAWEKGDQITLSGPLGSGKSLFARAFIRTLLGDSELTVPSPTFTLMQTYTHISSPLTGWCPETLIHADFYRLHDISDLLSLAWEDESENSLALIEWPENVPQALGPNRIDLIFSSVDGASEARFLTVRACGKKKDTLDFIRAAHTLVKAWSNTSCLLRFTPLDGDASTRRYVRVSREKEHALLMLSPPMTPTPYSLQTHLAHDFRPFIAMSHGLQSIKLSAPQIYDMNEDAGILLIEDLGTELLTHDGQSRKDRLQEAVQLLAFLHEQKCSETISYNKQGTHYVLPPYDRGALHTEISVFLEWYLKSQKITITPASQNAFFAAWDPLIAEVLNGPRTWTLRDYHSPNLLWLENRCDRARIGLLDFQDAVWGHPAYDLASLLQDARITIDSEDEKAGYAFYVEMRTKQDPSFDADSFSRAYTILAAQRATKVLGVFSRLIHRDGKSRYESHIPRVQSYLIRTLASSLFDHLRPWYRTHLPSIFLES